MPRAAPASVGGVYYHISNRGKGRRRVFRKEADYQAFLKALAHACIEIPMPVLGFCLVPNHSHLAVLPKGDPFGAAGWVKRTAERLHLQSTLRPRGRPRQSGATAAQANQ